MAERRLAKARQGYEDYVYRPPAKDDLAGATFVDRGQTYVVGPRVQLHTHRFEGNHTIGDTSGVAICACGARKHLRSGIINWAVQR